MNLNREWRQPRKPRQESDDDTARKRDSELVRADSAGTLTNLARLLNHGRLAGTGKLAILPASSMDRRARSNYHFELAIEAGCNAYAAPAPAISRGRWSVQPCRDTAGSALRVAVTFWRDSGSDGVLFNGGFLREIP